MLVLKELAHRAITHPQKERRRGGADGNQGKMRGALLAIHHSQGGER